MLALRAVRPAHLALALATLAFAANFSVWVLYAVLALQLQDSLGLSATGLGLLFAAPMVSGALLRIPAGVLCDRGDPRPMFAAQMLVVVPALLLLSRADSLGEYLLLGLWIGVSGTSFTFGISYVVSWFERNHQGTAMGIFGVGNAGAAITLALTPAIVEHWGWAAVGPAYGLGLLAVALLFITLAPVSPPGTSAPVPERGGRPVLMRLRIWRFGLYYYFVFGSFLALLLWLPQYYVNVYGFSSHKAMAYTLVFAVSSSMVRALGGWFADRYGGRAVNWSVFWICLVCLFFLSYPPTTMTIHGVHSDVHINIRIDALVFTLLITVIGIAQGFGRASVYKIIHDYYPRHMGTVGGFVAALGALGGATLPIAFGVAVDLLGIYSACFMLLYGVLALCMIVMFFANKTDRFRDRLREASQHNFLDLD